jgi:hypothetical protein
MTPDTPPKSKSDADTHSFPAGFGVFGDTHLPAGGFHLPVPQSVADRFGLPLFFDPASESRQQTELRYEAVLRVMIEVNDVATRQIGKRHAKLVWGELSKRKGGRPKGPADRASDSLLLATYDRCAYGLDGEERRRLPRTLAGRFKTEYPDKFPATEDAIATHIRRLLKRRAETQKEQTERVAVLAGLVRQAPKSPP